MRCSVLVCGDVSAYLSAAAAFFLLHNRHLKQSKISSLFRRASSVYIKPLPLDLIFNMLTCSAQKSDSGARKAKAAFSP